MLKNIDQERAKYAYSKVKEILDNDQELKDKYASKARRFPDMILANGLPQALLFLFSNENNNKDLSYQILLSHIRGWFDNNALIESRIYTYNAPTNEAFVSCVILERDAHTLCLITSEAIYLANWLKRFAEGLIGN
jgi:CRISPR-associated protein Cmr5